jgi:hypothetical protein
VTEQVWIPGTEPPPDPTRTPELAEAAALEAIAAVSQQSERLERAHAEIEALIALLTDVLAILPNGYVSPEEMAVIWRARAVVAEAKR